MIVEAGEDGLGGQGGPDRARKHYGVARVELQGCLPSLKPCASRCRSRRVQASRAEPAHCSRRRTVLLVPVSGSGWPVKVESEQGRVLLAGGWYQGEATLAAHSLTGAVRSCGAPPSPASRIGPPAGCGARRCAHLADRAGCWGHRTRWPNGTRASGRCEKVRAEVSNYNMYTCDP